MGIFNKKNKKIIKASKDNKDYKDKNDKEVKNIKETEKVEKKESMKDLYNDSNSQKNKDSKDDKDNKKTTKNKFNSAYKVLVKPLVTEKATNLGSESKYIFVVENNANKIEIAKAVNSVYGINPTSVNIIKSKGKKKRHGKIIGKRKDWKKAIITLPKGKSINVYEGV